MTDGLNLTGFNDTKPSEPTPWNNNEQYAQDPRAAFPAQDMSTKMVLLSVA